MREHLERRKVDDTTRSTAPRDTTQSPRRAAPADVDVAGVRRSPLHGVAIGSTRISPVTAASAMVGESARVSTRIQRSGAPVIRRKSLTELGVDKTWGLTATLTKGDKPVGASRPITEQAQLAGGKEALIYGDAAALAKAASKAEAMKSAATRAGDVGGRMHTWAKANWNTIRNTKNAKEQFEAKRIFKIEAGDENKIDPWVHKVEVPYKAGVEDHSLTMEFQHTKGFDGYVAKVADSSNPDLNKPRASRARANSRGAAMHMGKISSSDAVIEANADFSNLHDQTDLSQGKNLMALTGAGGHVAADSYTKLAGEGARFICVRDNMANLQNDSYFYYTVGEEAFGVTFATLWVSWQTEFKKAYNISNDDVLKKLKAKKNWAPKLPRAVDNAKDVKLG